MTYTIEFDRLHRINDAGDATHSWDLPDPDATIVSVTVGDYGGDSWCDVITLSDGRVVLVNVTDGETVACLYASDAAAWDCAPIMELTEV